MKKGYNQGMGVYEPLASKYRPNNLDDFIGQQHLEIELLKKKKTVFGKVKENLSAIKSC